MFMRIPSLCGPGALGGGGGMLPCIYCGVAELGPVGWAGGLSAERIQGIVMLRHLWPFHSWWWPK